MNVPSWVSAKVSIRDAIPFVEFPISKPLPELDQVLTPIVNRQPVACRNRPFQPDGFTISNFSDQ